MPYQSIGDYGIIGNMRTAALVGRNGSIDWLCFPRFDSPSIFGAILDDRKGGRFRIAPTLREAVSEQYCLPDTNVLLTRFVSPDGTAEITDFMPLLPLLCSEDCRMVRRVTVTRGSLKLRMECKPACNYGRAAHRTEVGTRSATFRPPGLSLRLASDVPLKQPESAVCAEFTLQAGHTATFVLHGVTQAEAVKHTSVAEGLSLLDSTIAYWQQWISKCNYRGRWREMVQRSALTLELLVYEPTGAVVAAPTCSLPERVSGERNWDYRFSWMRDSAFAVCALLRIGLADEADRFMSWIEYLCRQAKRGALLQTLYGIDGSRKVPEELLNHWEGYRGSGPVRVGNAAYKQLQPSLTAASGKCAGRSDILFIQK